MINVIFCFLILANQVQASDYLEMSKRLATLRTQVQQLDEEISEQRTRQATELSSYAMQRAELEATIRKEEIRKKQLQVKQSKLKKLLGDEGKGLNKLRPVVLDNIEKLSAYIETSLPYKKAERLRNIEEIKSELAKEEINSYSALSRLWSAFEDEQRLTREIQIAKESIEISGEQYLAEVLKVGSIAMFFSLENGEYGQAEKSPKGWTYSYLKSQTEISAVQKLFDGIRKQVKSAEYDIPLSMNYEEHR
jgi:hypothetical protein